jgi:GAF domain-containing protein
MSADLAGILRAVAEGRPVELASIAEATGDAALTEAVADLADRMSGLRQRSAELRSVMSSTRDLLEETDTDRLLQRIVDRAFELMDVDVAYLSVYLPERDELVVRAETGTVSPRFLGMIVPAGVGLASLAVRTRHPQWVEDYPTFDVVPHDPVIDAIMQEEQLRSLLGAPLVIEDQAMGVLFAASRRPHVFRADEIALLSAFAGHAALVLRLGRLLRDATDATAEAARRQHQAEWAASLHGELTSLVVQGHDADHVVGALAAALGREVVLAADAALSPLADALMQEPGVRAAVDEAVRQGRSVLLDAGEVELIAPVVSAEGSAGVLLVRRGDAPLSDVERRTVERSALTAALVILRRSAITDAEERVRGELATDLLDRSTRRADALRRAEARGYPIAEEWNVFAVPVGDDDRPAVLRRVRARDEWLGAAAPGGVTVLAPARHAVAEVVAHVQSGLRGAVVAAAGRDLSDAAGAAATTWQACQLAAGLGVDSGVVDAAVFSPYTSIFEGDGARLARFVSTTLAPVLAWDDERGSALFDTLVALFDERWALAATARRLHVHLNTVKQRVQRLHDILGPDLDRPESRFRLEMAVRVEAARRILDRTSPTP